MRSEQLRQQRSCKVVNNCVWSHEKTLMFSGTQGNANDQLTGAGGFPILCRTIDDILEEEGVGHVDFMSLDIESSEPQALRGMNFARFAPDVMAIETLWLNQTIHNTMFDLGCVRAHWACARACAARALMPPARPTQLRHGGLCGT